jgi:hypothetical protein
LRFSSPNFFPPIFISIPQQIAISVTLSFIPCSTVYFQVSSTRSSAYFTVRITSPPILKSPKPSRSSLVRYSLYELNRIGDIQHPCLNSSFSLRTLVSSSSSFSLNLGSPD